MNGGKLDLERMELLDYQQRKDKLVVGLWKTSQDYEVTTGH